MANLNYFKDPKTNVWRQPTEAELPEFSKSNPNAYKQYMTATGKPAATYGVGGTTANTGTGINVGGTNNNSNYYDNVVNSVDNYKDNSGFIDTNKLLADDNLANAATDAGTSSGWGFSNPFGKDGALSMDVKGAGGSNFSSAAAGLGSLYGMYAAHQGIGAAKDALNFQKQQYADQQAQQARANKKQDDFGLALSSAMPAKRVG